MVTPLKPVEFPAMIVNRMPAKPPGICRWFLACDHTADGYVEHSYLGRVITCQRCADKLDLHLVTPDAVEADKADGYDPAEPWMDPT